MASPLPRQACAGLGESFEVARFRGRPWACPCFGRPPYIFPKAIAGYGDPPVGLRPGLDGTRRRAEGLCSQGACGIGPSDPCRIEIEPSDEGLASLQRLCLTAIAQWPVRLSWSASGRRIQTVVHGSLAVHEAHSDHEATTFVIWSILTWPLANSWRGWHGSETYIARDWYRKRGTWLISQACVISYSVAKGVPDRECGRLRLLLLRGQQCGASH